MSRVDRPRLVVELDDVSFVHWPVDPDVVASQVPDPLIPDTRGGRAWLSAVCVENAARPHGTPAWLSRAYTQLNLRTYVRAGDLDGVYFFSSDVSSPLAALAGRYVFGLPTQYARIDYRQDGTEVSCRHRRRRSEVRFDATVTITGEPTVADGLDAWLIERYTHLRPSANGVRVGRIDHPPWPYASASGTVGEASLLASRGLAESVGTPRFGFSPGVQTVIGATRTENIEVDDPEDSSSLLDDPGP